jgi:glycine betaine/choline ABC-type transport system substrate-binding protein
MSMKIRLRALFVLLVASSMALGIAACGGGDDESSTTSAQAGLIQSNPDNGKVTLTVGSKNFTEDIILAEIYAQGLQAAGYNVKKQLNIGSETVTLKALQAGQISGYPEFTATALGSFFNVQPQGMPSTTQEQYQQAKTDLEKESLTAFPPAPYDSANAVGALTSTAKKLGVTTISDLSGKSQDLSLDGSPECRQRPDCLLGLEQDYGLKFKSFTPVDIGLRYTVLDNGQADLSILFTSDAQLAGAGANKYTLLTDDKHVLTPSSPFFITSQDVVNEAGPDLESTIAEVQRNLDLKTIQELNARVDIDKQEPSAVAHEYLKASGLVE